MSQLPPFLSLNEFTLFTLVLGRTAGIFSSLPLLGGERVPMKIRLLVILAMTLVLFPVLKLVPGSLPSDFPGVFVMVIAETLIGITLGVVARALFDAVEFCGQIVGMQMGFSMANLFDPTMGQTQLMSLFQSLLAMLLFLSLGAHHIFIRAMVESYTLIPLGGWKVSGELLAFLVATTSGLFVLGIKLAAPVMVALLATSVALGIMARAFPQMNIFMVSMPLNIGIGFLALGLSLLVFLRTLEISYGALILQIRTVFNILSG
ncbi:MAG: flagellar biosynthetic protein FliR [Geobacteraceae bacterium]|nr:flagellar biosynthetic protein FliR [Geobacteraceae bacterium]